MSRIRLPLHDKIYRLEKVIRRSEAKQCEALCRGETDNRLRMRDEADYKAKAFSMYVCAVCWTAIQIPENLDEARSKLEYLMKVYSVSGMPMKLFQDLFYDLLSLSQKQTERLQDEMEKMEETFKERLEIQEAAFDRELRDIKRSLSEEMYSNIREAIRDLKSEAPWESSKD